jgi:hypothetical protein
MGKKKMAEKGKKEAQREDRERCYNAGVTLKYTMEILPDQTKKFTCKNCGKTTMKFASHMARHADVCEGMFLRIFPRISPPPPEWNGGRFQERFHCRFPIRGAEGA